ncbi:MAG: methyltransferase domain-containing protein [Clostridiales bacterium]|jgi:cyclopropane fatty-acyl-phospholipid synthase-like methyltransferase|nr:methyltransferase domain-containing protein [Clostridiales bacterium]
MKYIRSKKYETNQILEKMMGPNPLKLLEELLEHHRIPQRATVMDLGSGQGVTSVFLAREYGFRVFAADLWSSPTENKRFFDRMGLTTEQIIPIHADANDLPFAEEFFDAVISVDSYHYFGRDPEYLGKRLLPFVKHGGFLYIAIPGMKRDCHEDLPPELLLSWTPEQLDTIHDTVYWTNLIAQTEGIDLLSVREMESNEAAWNDWLACDNEYARNDRKTMEAGGGRYLNFIAVVLQRK